MRRYDVPSEGYDRRLGDYFTNALDGNGCVLIASGDTQIPDPSNGGPQAVSHPLFIHQVSGPSLTTGQDCSAFAATNVPETVSPSLLPGAAALAVVGSIAWRRRRNQRSQ